MTTTAKKTGSERDGRQDAETPRGIPAVRYPTISLVYIIVTEEIESLRRDTNEEGEKW